MSIRQKTLQTVAMAGVVAMALFLAGCGGGGGTVSDNGGDTGGGTDSFMLPETSEMFNRLNAMDIMNDDPAMQEQMRMDEVDRFVERMNRATWSDRGGAPGSGEELEEDSSLRKIASATASWLGDRPDQPGLLTITIIPHADSSITPLVTENTAETKNYEKINGFDEGYNGFEIWREGTSPADQALAIVFTDKQQGTAEIEEVTAVTAEGLVYEPTSAGYASFDLSNVSADGRTITGVTYFEDSNNALDPGLAYTGTLTCPTGATCTYNTLDTGDIVIEGYVFSGTRPAREAVTGVPATEGPNDYLVFGLWLHETAMGAGGDIMESFGAFAWAGGTNQGRDGYGLGIILGTGKANYSGKAFGAHHMDGVISWFDANANLQIDLGTTTRTGDNVITGEISNIRIAGGDPLEDSIYLGGPISGNDNVPISEFTARMSPMDPNPYSQDWKFNGHWDYNRFAPSADQHPQRITGTFALNNEDNTEGFVGAFGTRRVTE